MVRWLFILFFFYPTVHKRKKNHSAHVVESEDELRLRQKIATETPVLGLFALWFRTAGTCNKSLSYEHGSECVSERINEHSGAREKSKKCDASKRVSGASE